MHKTVADKKGGRQVPLTPEEIIQYEKDQVQAEIDEKKEEAEKKRMEKALADTKKRLNLTDEDVKALREG
jgi:sugar-specific transcriptional regulator TrmB